MECHIYCKPYSLPGSPKTNVPKLIILLLQGIFMQCWERLALFSAEPCKLRNPHFFLSRSCDELAYELHLSYFSCSARMTEILSCSLTYHSSLNYWNYLQLTYKWQWVQWKNNFGKNTHFAASIHACPSLPYVSSIWQELFQHLAMSQLGCHMGMVQVGTVQPTPMVGFTHTCTMNPQVFVTLQVPINPYEYFVIFSFFIDLPSFFFFLFFWAVFIYYNTFYLLYNIVAM